MSKTCDKVKLSALKRSSDAVETNVGDQEEVSGHSKKLKHGETERRVAIEVENAKENDEENKGKEKGKGNRVLKKRSGRWITEYYYDSDPCTDEAYEFGSSDSDDEWSDDSDDDVNDLVDDICQLQPPSPPPPAAGEVVMVEAERAKENEGKSELTNNKGGKGKRVLKKRSGKWIKSYYYDSDPYTNEASQTVSESDSDSDSDDDSENEEEENNLVSDVSPPVAEEESCGGNRSKKPKLEADQNVDVVGADDEKAKANKNNNNELQKKWKGKRVLKKKSGKWFTSYYYDSDP